MSRYTWDDDIDATASGEAHPELARGASGRVTVSAGTEGVRERPVVRRGGSRSLSWDDDEVREGAAASGSAGDVRDARVRETEDESVGASGTASVDEGGDSGDDSNSEWEAPGTSPQEDFVSELFTLFSSRTLNAR